MLKKSVVKRSCWRSVILKFLISEKSQFCCPGPRNMLRPRFPKLVTQKLELGGAAVAGTLGLQRAGYKSGAVVNAAGFRYPSIRVPMLPVLEALARVLPAANCPLSVPGVKPAPRNAVPAPESVTEKGEPDWKMLMPLTAQSRSNAALA